MKPQIIGYASDLGGNDLGAAQGPLVLQQSEYLKFLNLEWTKILEATTSDRKLEALDAITDLCEKLASHVMHYTQQKKPFLTIGGDHSCAIGTWSGAADGIQGPLGLIWIDAHMDSHTPTTSFTKNIHGMPLAVLLGHGDKRLTKIHSKKCAVLPKNLILIGIRSFEKSEQNLLKRLKVRVYYIDEIKKRGLFAIMQEAIHYMTEKTSRFGISIDLDAIDPEEAPGVSAPEINGLSMDELLKSLTLVANHPQFIGAEIAEFNPRFDKNHQTEKIIAQLIQSLFFHPQHPAQ